MSSSQPPIPPKTRGSTLVTTPEILNNIGVDEIILGNVSNAIDILSRGLEKYRCSIEDDDERPRLKWLASVSDTPDLEHDIIDHWMSKSRTALSLLDETHDNVYFYNEPIRVPTSLLGAVVSADMLPSSSCLSYPAIHTAVALTFNLGLCFHDLGRDRSLSRLDQERMLRRSLSFFENAFRLQRTQYPRASESPLFFMAVINNIGILSQALGRQTTAVECFHQLMSLLMYMSTSRPSEISPQQWEGYFQNAASRPVAFVQALAACAA
jgi:hypothetical protein